MKYSLFIMELIWITLSHEKDFLLILRERSQESLFEAVLVIDQLGMDFYW